MGELLIGLLVFGACIYILAGYVAYVTELFDE